MLPKFSPMHVYSPWQARLVRTLMALESAAMPGEITTAEGRRFRFLSLFKHDCWAATGLYEEVNRPSAWLSTESTSGQLAVLKINRINPFFGIPLRGIGRFLTHREVKAYRLCQHLAGVPALLGLLRPSLFLLYV